MQAAQATERVNEIRGVQFPVGTGGIVRDADIGSARCVGQGQVPLEHGFLPPCALSPRPVSSRPTENVREVP